MCGPLTRPRLGLDLERRWRDGLLLLMVMLVERLCGCIILLTNAPQIMMVALTMPLMVLVLVLVSVLVLVLILM